MDFSLELRILLHTSFGSNFAPFHTSITLVVYRKISVLQRKMGTFLAIQTTIACLEFLPDANTLYLILILGQSTRSTSTLEQVRNPRHTVTPRFKPLS